MITTGSCAMDFHIKRDTTVPVRRTVRDTVRKRMEPFFVDGCLEMEADAFVGAGER